jgi:outer membrane murein-binding lipoprotein Lpp
MIVARILPVLLLAGCSDQARMESTRQEPQDLMVQALCRALSSDRPEEREQAAKELVAVGDPAVDALRELERISDAEGAARARSILDRIEKARSCSFAPEFASRPDQWFLVSGFRGGQWNQEFDALGYARFSASRAGGEIRLTDESHLKGFSAPGTGFRCGNVVTVCQADGWGRPLSVRASSSRLRNMEFDILGDHVRAKLRMARSAAFDRSRAEWIPDPGTTSETSSQFKVPTGVPLTSVHGLYRVACLLPQVAGRVQTFTVLIPDHECSQPIFTGDTCVCGIPLSVKAEVRCLGFEEHPFEGKRVFVARFRTKVLYEMDFFVSVDRRLLGVVLPTAEVQLGWQIATPEEGARVRNAILPASVSFPK